MINSSKKQEMTNVEKLTQLKYKDSADLYTSLPAVFVDLDLTNKHKILSIWLTGERIENSKTLDIMFALDDLYQYVYSQNRIKSGFQAAKLFAYEKILTTIYGG